MNYKYENNMKLNSITFDSSETFTNFLHNLINYYEDLKFDIFMETKEMKYNLNNQKEFFTNLYNITDFKEIRFTLTNRNISIEIKIYNYERPRHLSSIIIKANDINSIIEAQNKIRTELRKLKNKLSFMKKIPFKIFLFLFIYLIVSRIIGYNQKVATYENALYSYNDILFWLIILYSIIIVFTLEYSFAPVIRLKLNKKFSSLFKEQVKKNVAAIIITIFGIILSLLLNIILNL